MQDLLRPSAVVRQLEVMGEAIKRLSPEFRAAHSEVPWREMAGMRDILIHACDHVVLDVVWDTATKAAPSVREWLVVYLPKP